MLTTISYTALNSYYKRSIYVWPIFHQQAKKCFQLFCLKRWSTVNLKHQRDDLNLLKSRIHLWCNLQLQERREFHWPDFSPHLMYLQHHKMWNMTQINNCWMKKGNVYLDILIITFCYNGYSKQQPTLNYINNIVASVSKPLTLNL